MRLCAYICIPNDSGALCGGGNINGTCLLTVVLDRSRRLLTPFVCVEYPLVFELKVTCDGRLFGFGKYDKRDLPFGYVLIHNDNILSCLFAQRIIVFDGKYSNIGGKSLSDSLLLLLLLLKVGLSHVLLLIVRL